MKGAIWGLIVAGIVTLASAFVDEHALAVSAQQNLDAMAEMTGQPAPLDMARLAPADTLLDRLATALCGLVCLGGAWAIYRRLRWAWPVGFWMIGACWVWFVALVPIRRFFDPAPWAPGEGFLIWLWVVLGSLLIAFSLWRWNRRRDWFGW